MINSYKLDEAGLNFTRRWFRQRNLGTFVRHVLPEFVGKPFLYFEIGVFEGMSMSWMFQHVLTNPQSKAVGIDPWQPHARMSEERISEAKTRAYSNLQKYIESGRLLLVTTPSEDVLPKMLTSEGFLGISKNSVDLCMIDGDHHADAVFNDAIQVLELVKPGGVMLFDDVEKMLKKEGVVREGLDRFVEYARDRISIAWTDGYMEAYRKV